MPIGGLANRRAVAATIATAAAVSVAAVTAGATSGSRPGQQSDPPVAGGATIPAAHHHLGPPDVERARPQRVLPAVTLEPRPTAVPERGSGEFAVAALAPSGPADPTATYTVEVELGLDFEVARTARKVDRVLTDPRGWAAAGHRLRRGTHGDFRVLLATPETADALCAPLDTGGRLSCRNGLNVVINAWRWVHGTDDYRGRLEAYRTYVVNHEVGHALGYGHTPCPAPGERAPVMHQQTKGLDGCRPNVWPAAVDLR